MDLELNVDNSAFYDQFVIAQVGGVLGGKRSGYVGDGGRGHNRQIPDSRETDSDLVGPSGEVQVVGVAGEPLSRGLGEPGL